MKNRLAEFRRESRISQAELGAEVMVSRQTINAIENQRFDPSLPLAFRLACYFSVTIEEMFLFEG